MPPFHSLLTHPGGAHNDEFLACCVLLAAQAQAVPVLRREPTLADLEDSGVAVIDVGHRHEPERNNFDHHQFPREHPPTCALSLVLQALRLYDDAREFSPWLETAEWFDSRGPFGTAAWLGVDREVLSKLASPIVGTLLRRFAASTRLEPHDPLSVLMREVGRDILDTVQALRSRLAYLGTHGEFWPLELPKRAAEIFFVPRLDPLPDEPSHGIEEFLQRRGKTASVVGLVYPDRRNTGYALARFRDAADLDFTRIAQETDVHFAHARGFVAKTSATERTRLRELLAKARSDAT
jgi:hypothetical protein